MFLSNSALSWLCEVLEERFGHAFILSYKDTALFMRLPGHSATVVFNNLSPVFGLSTMHLGCASWKPEGEGFNSALGGDLLAPGVANLPRPLITFDTGECRAYVGYDVLGLAYWMLNRIEEIDSSALDGHGRYPAVSSHAFKHGYLERPIVDEWLHILKQVIERIWPAITIKEHHFTTRVSHDVDRPARYGFAHPRILMRRMVGDVVKHRDVLSALRGPLVRMKTRKRLHPKDRFNTFDWLMDLSESHNLTSSFYFICGRTDELRDADYEIEHPAIRDLLRRIHLRGHEIGLHPSYDTYLKPELIDREYRRLRRVCDGEGIVQSRWGGRMHYLRWKHPFTLQAWEDAFLSYDSTLGYPDIPGFRCGTCFEYPAFNPVTQTSLRLRIRPLIAMECSVIADDYMGLGYGEEALMKFLELKEVCRKLNGVFTLLWHNSELDHKLKRTLYSDVLER